MELNDFPKTLVQKTIKNTLHKDIENKIQEDDYSLKLFLPYEKGISEQISRICRKFNVRVVHTKGRSLKNIVKEKHINQNDMNNPQGVVYKVLCKDCDMYYIGETGRHLSVRLNEHKANARNKTINMSGLSQHIVQCNHEVEWDDVKILCRENDFKKRKFQEAIAIKNDINRAMNKKEDVKVISNIWENLI